MLPVGDELMDEAGGEGNVGWRKPPGPGASEAELMEKDGWWGVKSGCFAVGSSPTEREGDARSSTPRDVEYL